MALAANAALKDTAPSPPIKATTAAATTGCLSGRLVRMGHMLHAGKHLLFCFTQELDAGSHAYGHLQRHFNGHICNVKFDIHPFKVE